MNSELIYNEKYDVCVFVCVSVSVCDKCKYMDILSYDKREHIYMHPI